MTRAAALMLLLLFPSCFPSSLAVWGSVGESGTADVFVAADLPGYEGVSVCLALPGEVKNVVVKDRSGLELRHSVTSERNFSLICSTVPSDYVKFAVSSDSFTSKDESTWNLDIALGFSENVSDFEASLTLPHGAVLKSTNGAVQGSGGSLAILWTAGSLDTAHLAHLRASYELTGRDDATLLVWLGLVIALAYLAIAYLRRRKQPLAIKPEPAKNPLESNSVFKTLDETDKDIIREIRAQKGKTTQAHLYLHTHVPKATLSRRLASLENRGVIMRSQKGNRKLVTLTDVLTN